MSLGLGATVILAAWVPTAIGRRPVSLPIVLVAFGGAVFALPWFAAPNPREYLDVTRVVTEFGVLVALLGAGIGIDRRLGWRRWSTTWRLLSVGMVASIGGISLLGWWLLDLDAATAILLGAVLAPTDPVLAGDVQVGEPVLEDQRLDDEDDVRFGLTSEAGGNDGLAFPFVHLALVVAAGSEAAEGAQLDRLVHWFGIDLVARIGVAIGTGWLFGRVLGRLVFNGAWRFPPIATERRGFVSLGVILAAYGSTELIGGYGFLAVFLAAVFLRRQRNRQYHLVLHASRARSNVVARCSSRAVRRGTAPARRRLGWRDVAVAAGVLFVVRPLSGHLAMLASPVRGAERRAIAFFGIRGLGSVYYLAYAATIEPSGTAGCRSVPTTCGRS
ncbi:MAG: cation:proton antiporter [Ilumatobacteraceae bacterium]